MRPSCRGQLPTIVEMQPRASQPSSPSASSSASLLLTPLFASFAPPSVLPNPSPLSPPHPSSSSPNASASTPPAGPYIPSATIRPPQRMLTDHKPLVLGLARGGRAARTLTTLTSSPNSTSAGLPSPSFTYGSSVPPTVSPPELTEVAAISSTATTSTHASATAFHPTLPSLPSSEPVSVRAATPSVVSLALSYAVPSLGIRTNGCENAANNDLNSSRGAEPGLITSSSSFSIEYP